MSADHPFTNASRGIRLQKAMAEAGVASRRDCEALVVTGRVHVNGHRVQTLPAWVDPDRDRIEVDGDVVAGKVQGRTKRSSSRTGGGGKTYIMLHKPRGVICTNSDPGGRKRLVDLVRPPGSVRLFPVGRLDADSTGLILLTNDGEMANRLAHPRYGVPKRYLVSVRGRLSHEALGKLREGFYLSDQGHPHRPRLAGMERVRIVSHESDRTRGDRTTLSVTLLEGRNREIRRLLARLGFKTHRLKRVAIGPLKLKGLAEGQWRMLNAAERRQLRRLAGMAQHRGTASGSVGGSR